MQTIAYQFPKFDLLEIIREPVFDKKISTFKTITSRTINTGFEINQQKRNVAEN